MSTEVAWCFAHQSQVIRTWEHPLLTRLQLATAWCDVGDYLRDHGVDPGECEIGQVVVDRQRDTIEGEASTPLPVR